MDRDKLNNEILNVLEEFKDLHVAYEESKKAQEELVKLVALLQEELKLARDAERISEFRKNRCQAFVIQQQDVFLKLLSVKEENENLKHTIREMEKTISDIQNSKMADHVKRDTEMQELKQNHMNELIKIQEAADDQVINVKAELATTIEDLKEIISKNEEKIEQQSNNIHTLQNEIQNLKERAAVNVDIFQKKLAEQERNYQEELETWKIAEINRTTYQQNDNTVSQYRTNPCSANNYQIPRQMPDYQHNKIVQRYQNQTPRNTHINQKPYSTTPTHVLKSPQPFYKLQPHVTHSRTLPVLPRVATNSIQPLPSTSENSYNKNTEFLSATDFYMKNNNSNGDDAIEENPSALLGDNNKQYNIVQKPSERLGDNNQYNIVQKPSERLGDNNQYNIVQKPSERLGDNNNQYNIVQKPKVPVPNRKRKLFNGQIVL